MVGPSSRIDTAVTRASVRPIATDAGRGGAELSRFATEWFAGFDRHATASFFLNRLSRKGFLIQFPDQPPIRSAAELIAWHAGVDGLSDVKHEIKSIEVLAQSERRADVALRVDWSARDGGNRLFFPAAQRWSLVREGSNWKLASYLVERAPQLGVAAFRTVLDG